MFIGNNCSNVLLGLSASALNPSFLLFTAGHLYTFGSYGADLFRAPIRAIAIPPRIERNGKNSTR